MATHSTTGLRAAYSYILSSKVYRFLNFDVLCILKEEGDISSAHFNIRLRVCVWRSIHPPIYLSRWIVRMEIYQ